MTDVFSAGPTVNFKNKECRAACQQCTLSTWMLPCISPDEVKGSAAGSGSVRMQREEGEERGRGEEGRGCSLSIQEPRPVTSH